LRQFKTEFKTERCNNLYKQRDTNKYKENLEQTRNNYKFLKNRT